MPLIHGNSTQNFFEQNPEYRYYDAINNLLKHHSEDQASRLIWAVYLVEHPSSPFYKKFIDDRRHIVAKNYLQEEDFDWEEPEIKDLIRDFPSIFMSKGEIMFKIWMDKFEEGTIWIKNQTFDENASGLFKQLGSVKSTWTDFLEMKEKFDIEQAKQVETRGDRKMGAAAKRRAQRRSEKQVN